MWVISRVGEWTPLSVKNALHSVQLLSSQSFTSPLSMFNIYCKISMFSKHSKHSVSIQMFVGEHVGSQLQSLQLLSGKSFTSIAENSLKITERERGTGVFIFFHLPPEVQMQ